MALSTEDNTQVSDQGSQLVTAPADSADRSANSGAHSPKAARWAAASGFFGAIAEYYDFALYAPAAAILFGPLFFEPLGQTGAVLASLASFGVAYLVRPLGAVVFGSVGDRVGRRPALLTSLALMGAATTLIGVLPTYQAAGWLAPILLLLLRVAQGMAAGVEQAGSTTLSAESAPVKKRGVYTSWTMIGVALGWFAGPAVMGTVAARSDMLTAGTWRIPFLLALPIALVALAIRWQVTEPDRPRRTAVSKRTDTGEETAPLRLLLRDHRGNLLRVIGCSLHMLVGVTCNVFVVGYAVNTMQLSSAMMLGALSIAGLTTAFTQPFFAWISDRIGRKPVFIASCLGLAACLPLLMLSLHSSSGTVITVAFLLYYLIVMAGNVVQASFYPELFPASVRFTGVSVGTQLGLVIVGISPVIYRALQVEGAYGWWPAAVFAAVCWIVAALSAYSAKPFGDSN